MNFGAFSRALLSISISLMGLTAATVARAQNSGTFTTFGPNTPDQETFGLSADGSTVIGGGFLTGSPFMWTAQTGLVHLGSLGGTFGDATGVSANGGVVVGFNTYSDDPAVNHDNTVTEAFRWTAATGMVGLGFLGLNAGVGNSQSNGVSADGSTIVGSSSDGNGHTEAFRWTSATGMVGLGFLNAPGSGPQSSSALAASADGSVIIGTSLVGNNALPFSNTETFRWTAATGMVGLGFIGGEVDALPFGLSADGSVVIGNSFFRGGSEEAWRWTAATGLVGLGFLSTSVATPTSQANGISSDGSTIVGFSLTSSGRGEAFRWTASTGMVGLGFIGGGGSTPFSDAIAVNATGSVIIGESSNAAGNAEVFRWTAATGTQSLATLLANVGVNLNGFNLRETGQQVLSYFISADGQFISGLGERAGSNQEVNWIVRYLDATVGGTGPIGGLTTAQSVQDSVTGLGSAASGVMAQEHGFAAPLLGDNLPINGALGAGAYGAAGSAAGGLTDRMKLGEGLTLNAGLAYTSETYAHVSMSDALLFGGALRYVYDVNSGLHLFGEAGGFLSPSGSYQFSRTYVNGAGTATGTGGASGTQTYMFGRLGPAFMLSQRDEIALSGELGWQRLHVGSYSEPLSNGNPFNAFVTESIDTMDVTKARVQWTHGFSPQIDMTVWGAAARGFNFTSDVVATVPGVGTFSPIIGGSLSWFEYGARASYRVTDLVSLDLFADGVTGDGAIGSKVHVGGGAKVRF